MEKKRINYSDDIWEWCVQWWKMLYKMQIKMHSINFKRHRIDRNTVEPCYNENLGTMKITLLYQGKKTKKCKELMDLQNDHVIRGFCYIRPLYKEVPLYIIIWRKKTLHISICPLTFDLHLTSGHDSDCGNRAICRRGMICKVVRSAKMASAEAKLLDSIRLVRRNPKMATARTVAKKQTDKQKVE